MNIISPSKKELRKLFLAKRNALSAKEIDLKTQQIKSQLFKFSPFAESSTILFYASFGNEVKTFEMMEECIKKGKILLLPRTISTTYEMQAVEVKNLSKDLQKSKFGVLEPIANSEINIPSDIPPDILYSIDASFLSYNLKVFLLEQIDVVIVPGICFDKKGYRIGFGAGYYDRFLKKLPKQTVKIGLSFDLQVVDEILFDSYDQRVNYVITEQEIINCK